MRYFFNVHDGHSIIDPDGTECTDVEQARVLAVRTAGALLKDAATTFWNGEEWRMEVTDALGLVQFSLYFVGVMAPAAKRG